MRKLFLFIGIILAINISGQPQSFEWAIINTLNWHTEVLNKLDSALEAGQNKPTWEIQGDSIVILEGGEYHITFPIYDSRDPYIIRTGPDTIVDYDAIVDAAAYNVAHPEISKDTLDLNVITLEDLIEYEGWWDKNIMVDTLDVYLRFQGRKGYATIISDKPTFIGFKEWMEKQ